MMVNSTEDYHENINNGKILRFVWYDYLIFAIMLAFSTSVGIYYGCFGRKQRTVNRYLLGGKKMSVFPIALSVAVGHFSALAFTAFPADVYKYGTHLVFVCVSMIILGIISVYFYYSVFFKLQITSVYEYLEKRFDRKTRLLASLLWFLSEALFIPIVAYGPTLALTTAAGMDVKFVSILLCVVCTFYTAIGGLKTVVWTDFYQLATILLSLGIVCVIGVKSAGGLAVILNKAVEGERFDIFDLDLDPTRRQSIWIVLFGFTGFWINYVGLSQSTVQKFLALPTFKDCVRAVVCFILVMEIVYLSATFLGLLLYEKYADCDLLLSKRINKHDQMVPYYVMDITGGIPGVTGFFLVALYCAALSTISSSLNALSGVVYTDFVSRFFKKTPSEKKAVLMLKAIVIILGMLLTILAVQMDQMGDIFPLATTLPSLAGGPLMGVFTMGVLFPRANAKGAFYGAACGLIFMTSIVLPVKVFHYDRMIKYPSKPLSIKGCNDSLMNSTVTYSVTLTEQLTNSTENSTLPFIFRISHMYYTLMGSVVTMVLGLGISYATNKNDPPVDKDLISPLCHYFVPKEGSKTSASLLQKDAE